jgi:hypothetical protein
MQQKLHGAVLKRGFKRLPLNQAHSALKKTCALILFSALAPAFSGCGTIPDVHALLHAKDPYLENSDFVGPRGSLTMFHWWLATK